MKINLQLSAADRELPAEELLQKSVSALAAALAAEQRSEPPAPALAPPDRPHLIKATLIPELAVAAIDGNWQGSIESNYQAVAEQIKDWHTRVEREFREQFADIARGNKLRVNRDKRARDLESAMTAPELDPAPGR